MMKKSLILVPGLLCDEQAWSAQTAALADLADIHVAVHGDLDSLGALAEAIIASAPERFAIAGHSMGGRIALEVARRVPQRLTGIALLDTGYERLPLGEDGLQEHRSRYAMLELARREGMRAMGRKWLQGMVHASRLPERGPADHELTGAILNMFGRKTPELFALQIRALLNRADAQAVLAGIRCPALVLCGREDVSAPPSRHAGIAAMIPRSTLTIISECGHMSTLERPQAVNEAMRAWLESTPHE